MPPRRSCKKLRAAARTQYQSVRLDSMARKKDEKAARRKERKSDAANGDAKSLTEQLAKIGLKVRDVIGDGNCLFRALADQLDGDDRSHGRHRQDVVRYMKEHRSDFEPFIEDDVPFDQHLKNLAEDGTYAGNDAIVAFARLHKLTVVIHQLESPAWEVHGESFESSSSGSDNVLAPRQLHILYHNHEHYSSVRRIDDDTDSPANVRVMVTRSPVNPKNIAESKKSDRTVSLPSAGHRNVVSGRQRDDLGSDQHAAEFISKVLACTKCRNESLVRDLCSDACYYDVDSVCALVQAIMDESPVSSASTSSSPSDVDSSAALAPVVEINAAVCGAKPKARQQQTVKRRQRKQEKKARAVQRHREEALGCRNKTNSSDEDDLTPYMITENLKVLQI